MNKRGVAGLPLLLSMITILFLIGMIVFLFTMMGSNLANELPDAVEGSVGGFYEVGSPDSNSDYGANIVAEGCWDSASTPYSNPENMFDGDLNTYAEPSTVSGSYQYTKWYLPTGANISNSYLELKIGNSTTEWYPVYVNLSTHPINETTAVYTDGGGDYVFFVINTFASGYGSDVYVLGNVTDAIGGDGVNDGWDGSGCLDFNSYFAGSPPENIAFQRGERVYEVTMFWDADVQGQEGSPAKPVIEDTTTSLAGVTTWFAIIIVIGAMVVLIGMVVLIFNAIKQTRLVSA